MPERLLLLAPELWRAFGDTLLLLGIGLCAAIVLGGPLGVALFLSGAGGSARARRVGHALGWLVNTVRSFPFLILMVALAPLTGVLAGAPSGPLAAAAPLSCAAVACFARLVEQQLRDVPRGVIEAAHAMGASWCQIVTRVLLVEARAKLVLALTLLAVSFLSYAAVAGVVGGGGIGELAIRYGYHRFETDVMAITVAILAALVQLIQFGGARLARRLDKR